jgi:hypothetical protein
MKLLIPIFKTLPLQSGFSIQAPPGISQSSANVILWQNFKKLNEKQLQFSHNVLTYYLNELFSEAELQVATLATLEPISHVAGARIPSYEAELRISHDRAVNEAVVLYDLIPDKKPGHTYTPILHNANATSLTDKFDTFQILLNYRNIPAETSSQKMHIKAMTSSNQIADDWSEELSFNSTHIFSIKKIFKQSYENAGRVEFKGGNSQFAIFNLMFNESTSSLGIEHSLPPYYFASDIYKIPNRSIFYDRAFSKIKEG